MGSRPPDSIYCCSFFKETFVFLFIYVFVYACLFVCAPCSDFMTVTTSSLSSTLESSRCSLHHQTSPVDSSSAVPFDPSFPTLPFSSILNYIACIFFFVLDDCNIFPCLPSPWPVLGSFHLVQNNPSCFVLVFHGYPLLSLQHCLWSGSILQWGRDSTGQTWICLNPGSVLAEGWGSGVDHTQATLARASLPSPFSTEVGACFAGTLL